LSDWKRKVTAEYVPTDAQRSLVESASAFGITQAEIATQLKISEPTLRKHFREELDGGAFKAPVARILAEICDAAGGNEDESIRVFLKNSLHSGSR
jgi:DNA-binding Lrp family transcriptional regulator